MPVPTQISDLSNSAAVNSPQGTESAKGTIDDYLRSHAAFIKQTSDLVAGATVVLPSAATVNIGFAGSGNISITGTTTITAFDVYAEGAIRNVVFSGAMVLTYNATSMILPGSTSVTTASGDTATFKSLGAGKWQCLSYQRSSGSGGAIPLIQQGTGTGQLGNTVKIGWSGTKLKATIDSSDMGNIALESWAQPAIGYTPYNASNPAGYISGISGGNVISALGYTPQNASAFAVGGLAEVGRYFDFHGTTGANDYDVRFDAGPTPGVNGAGNATLTCASFTVSGALSGAVVTQTSDERKKEGWRDLPADFVAQLAAIERSGTFDWIDSGATSIGVGAQSLERILPEAVHTDDEGGKTVNYGGAALAACVALAREVAALRAELDALRGGV